MKSSIAAVKRMMLHKAMMTDAHCVHHIKQPMHMNKKSNRRVKHGGKM